MNETQTTVVNTNRPETIDKGDMVVNLNTFKEEFKDFSYYSPRAKTLPGLIKHLDEVTKGKGEETALLLANSNLEFRFRGKAKQMLKSKEDNRKKVAEGRTLLISADDAMAYEPGSRDSLSEQGLLRKRTEAFENAKEAKKLGKMDEYKKFALEAIEYTKQLDELAAKAMEEIADVVSS